MTSNDLKKFCSTDELRKDLTRPFSQGEKTYATDGHILIRVDRLKDIDEKQIVQSNILETFEKKPEKWYKIKDIVAHKITCPECGGDGKNYTCPECNGEKYVSVSSDFSEYDDIDCATCNATGRISEQEFDRIIKSNKLSKKDCMCEECNGTGESFSIEKTKYGDALFNNYLLIRIADLPNAEIGTFGEYDAALFRFDGGEGLIMPTR